VPSSFNFVMMYEYKTWYIDTKFCKLGGALTYARVSYSDYYASLPSWRRGFDSLYPLQVRRKASVYAIHVRSLQLSLAPHVPNDKQLRLVCNSASVPV
jgi:hypothetical protein